MNNNRTLSNIKRFKGNYFFEDDMILDGNISVKNSTSGDTLTITPSSILYNSNLTIATQTSGTTQANISALETKTQNMTFVNNVTTFSGNVVINTIQSIRKPICLVWRTTSGNQQNNWSISSYLNGSLSKTDPFNMYSTGPPLAGIRVPRNGFYQLVFNIRFQDTRNDISIRPLVDSLAGATYLLNYSDSGNFYVPDDDYGTNARRNCSFTGVYALTTNQYVDVQISFPSASTVSVGYAYMSLEYLGEST